LKTWLFIIFYIIVFRMGHNTWYSVLIKSENNDLFKSLISKKSWFTNDKCRKIPPKPFGRFLEFGKPDLKKSLKNDLFKI